MIDSDTRKLLRQVEHDLGAVKVEDTIRDLATELAGIFYDGNRSVKFRKAYPTLKDYMRGREHQSDGRILHRVPGWRHHVKLAREMLVRMLGMPDARVSPEMKMRIYDAIIEDRQNEHKYGGKKLVQAAS